MKKFLLNMLVAGIYISAPLYPNWIKTPENLSYWLIQNFTYQAEEEDKDHWKKPEETIRDKGGDCEDISFLADKILSDLGYETKVIAVYFKSSGHAICIIKENNKYTHLSNQYYFSTQYNSIQELIKSNYPKYISYQYIQLK